MLSTEPFVDRLLASHFHYDVADAYIIDLTTLKQLLFDQYKFINILEMIKALWYLKKKKEKKCETEC